MDVVDYKNILFSFISHSVLKKSSTNTESLNWKTTWIISKTKHSYAFQLLPFLSDKLSIRFVLLQIYTYVFLQKKTYKYISKRWRWIKKYINKLFYEKQVNKSRTAPTGIPAEAWQIRTFFVAKNNRFNSTRDFDGKITLPVINSSKERNGSEIKNLRGCA